jgi:hypothetical protein
MIEDHHDLAVALRLIVQIGRRVSKQVNVHLQPSACRPKAKYPRVLVPDWLREIVPSKSDTPERVAGAVYERPHLFVGPLSAQEADIKVREVIHATKRG